MDSCSDPDSELLNRLYPDRRELVSLALARPGVRAGVLKTAVRMAGARHDPGELADGRRAAGA
jgi:hypothetical protein